MRLSVMLLAVAQINGLIIAPVRTPAAAWARVGSIRASVSSWYDSGVRLPSSPAAPTPAGPPFSAEETAALQAASVSQEAAWKGKGEICPPELANMFSRPAIYFSLLRNPNKDPPEEIWDCIRAEWPVVAARSNKELLEALKPIKAVTVDIRSL
tara:strand:- start:852 stop:1313 length:462 start_codon:yes stop_codon:yes gene_type:complete